jgi:hypothetical protein
MNRFYMALTIVVLVVSAVSCSGSGSGVTSPKLDDISQAASAVNAECADNTALWGLWEIAIDPVNGTIEAVPMRGATFSANVTRFVDGPPPNLTLKLGSIDVQPGYMDIPVDVGLKHPFPGLDSYTGFDVLGVFMGNGSSTYPGPVGFTVAGQEDQRLLNADGYTRWFNAPEFTGAGSAMALLGYKPGKLGSNGYTPTATLNPYKYFADNLGKDDDAFAFLENNSSDRGSFSPGNINYRHYDIRFPDIAGLKFQYAVVAHWEPNVNAPNPPANLNDFPPSANSDEALVLSVVDSSTLFYQDATTNGGSVVLNISPLDWSAVASGPMAEYSIKVFSSAWTGSADVDMTPVGSGSKYYTYHADIPATSLSSANPLPIWIEVDYPGLDYSNKFGVPNDASGTLASYFTMDIPVDGNVPGSIEVLAPNGGETLQVGGNFEITWDSSNVTGTVFIDYSKDNFVSDIQSIATDETNDGSYLWTNIPNDPSTTVRVRVSSTDIPSVFDISDADFTIKFGNGWVKTWGSGGNDHAYAITKDSNGNMYVTGFYFSTVDFNPDPAQVDNHSGFGSWDSFVSKFAPDGTFVWAKTWGATGYADSALDVAVDNNGNVFVSGWWQNDMAIPQIDLDPGAGVDWHYGKVGDNIYLINLNSSGDYQWGYSWSSIDWAFSEGNGLTTDGSGNVYMTGAYQNTIDWDPGPGVANLTPVGWKDAFLLKLDSSGTYQWALSWGGAGMNDYGYNVCLDSTGNILVCGQVYGSNIDFDPGPGTDIRNANGWDAFLSSFSPGGNYQWAKMWGGSGSDDARDVAIDTTGNIFVTGSFAATVDFNPDGGVENHSSAGGTDSYVSKFDSSGAFLWAKTWGGTSDEIAYGVGTDLSGSVAVTGYYQGTADFDPANPGTIVYTANTSHDAYMVKLSDSGIVAWANAWGGAAQTPGGGVEDEGWGVISDISGNFYSTGVFQNTCDFEPGPGVTEVTAGGGTGVNDCFLLKFLPNGGW